MIRVLVVDDDDDIRTVLRIVLELEGMEVVTACDGVEGLEVAHAQRPDAVLLDVNMPRMNGMQMLAALREDPALGHLPVLMLTARAETDDAVEALRAGADDHIAKPFDPRLLAARIEAVVRRGSQQRALNPLTGLPGNESIQAEL
ncbi:MAG: response regulator, partial [Nitriliruptoraceae bacterium]